MGSSDATVPLRVIVALRLANESDLHALAEAPAHAPLSHQALVARHSPAPAAVDQVTTWLASRGLAVTSISSDRTLLTIDTTVRSTQRAFGVALHDYRVGSTVVRANLNDPQLPTQIAPLVRAIVGLTSAPLTQPHRAHAMTQNANGTVPFGPGDLRHAYDADPLLDSALGGTNVTVAITTWGAADPTSLAEYNANYGLPDANLASRDQRGGTTCSGGDVEWDLDAQMVHAMAPAANILVYCGDQPTFADMLAAVGNVVADDTADVVTQSWGACEAYVDVATANAYDDQFSLGAAQGQAFFTSSGDGGSRPCAPHDPQIQASFPGSAPDLTSASGTSLVLENASYVNESAWNTCAPCGNGYDEATGGAPSFLFAAPSWQRGVTNSSARMTGDLSSVADPATGVQIRSFGDWWQVGGTSVSSPTQAGIWAEVITATGRLGNPAPILYQIASTSAYATAIRDVANGTNGDFSAAVGYDAPTGLGSPRAAGILGALRQWLPSPRHLVATGADKSISLSWASVAAAESYHVYGANTTDPMVLIATVTDPTFIETNLADGALRSYRVAAVNTSGEGFLSRETNAQSFGPPLTAPTAFEAQPGPHGGNVTLSWTPPADGGSPIESYRIYRANESPNVPTANTTGGARLDGNERFVLQMDERDHDQPHAGQSRDASPSHEDATVAGASVTTGRFGNALQFHGVNDYATVPDRGVMNEGTITMWVRWDASAQHRLFYKQAPGRYNELALRVQPNGTIFFQTDQASPGLWSTTTVAPSTWTHLAVTWGPAGKRIYLDGVLDASNNDSTPVGPSYYVTMLGNSPNDLSTGGLLGALDDVREMNAALSIDEIQSVMTLPYRTDVVPPLYADLSPTSTFYDTGIPENSSRYYRIDAVNAYGVSAVTPELRGRTFDEADIVPTALHAIRGPQRGEITLAWHAPAWDGDATPLGYRVYGANASENSTLLATVTDANFVDTSVSDGQLRTYHVTALTSDRESGPSASASNITIGPPRTSPAYAYTRIGPGRGEITLYWGPAFDDGGSNVTNYIVDAIDNGTAMIVARPTGTNATVGGMGDNVQRNFTIRAENAFGAGPATRNVTGWTPTTPHWPPFVYDARGGPQRGEISFRWYNEYGLNISTNIYRSNATQNETLYASSTGTSFTDSNLTDNTTFTYRLTTVNVVGEGPSSDRMSVTTFRIPDPPAAFTATTGPQPGEVTVTWHTPVSGDAPIAEYRVFSSDPNENASRINTTTATSFVERGLGDGHARSYRVTAVDVVGESASAFANGSSAIPPTPPTNFTALYGATPVGTQLTWTPPITSAIEGTSAYVLTRRVDNEANATILAQLGAQTLSYTDVDCELTHICHYAIASIGILGQSAPSAETLLPGVAVIVRSAGGGSTDPTHAHRLIGHEITALGMDAADAVSTLATRDASMRQDEGLVTGPTLGLGRFGDAYHFGGAGDFVALRDQITSGLTSGTLMMWVRPDAAVTPRHALLLSKVEPGVNGELVLGLTPQGGSYFFTSQEMGSRVLASPPGLVGVGNWTHVAVTWGHEGKRIYANGALVASNNDTTPVGSLSSATELGIDPNDHANTGFLGTLDEVRIYDVALDGTMIRDVATAPYAGT